MKRKLVTLIVIALIFAELAICEEEVINADASIQIHDYYGIWEPDTDKMYIEQNGETGSLKDYDIDFAEAREVFDFNLAIFQGIFYLFGHDKVYDDLCYWSYKDDKIIVDYYNNHAIFNVQYIEDQGFLLCMNISYDDNSINVMVPINKVRTFDNHELQCLSKIRNYNILWKDMNGKEVAEIQGLLYENKYLFDKADGNYGNKTKAAVEFFQSENSLPITGIVDRITAAFLHSDVAKQGKSYTDLDYQSLSRKPANYMKSRIVFTGKVLQVIEDVDDNIMHVSLRISTKGSFDDIVYVTADRDIGLDRILEDDKIVVYAESNGLYTYESIGGSQITLPFFEAQYISIQE